MPIEEGVYKAELSTARGRGACILTLKAGEVIGIDRQMTYFGSYREVGNSVSAEIKIRRHTFSDGSGSLFGVDHVDAEFTGSAIGQGYLLVGTAAESPGVQMKARLTFVGPA